MTVQLKKTPVGFIAVLAALISGCGGNEAEVTTAGASGLDAASEVSASAGGASAGSSAEDDDNSLVVPISALEVAYGETEDRNHVGYFAAPEQIVEPLPGIVLVHERWGLDDSMREIARNLAQEGYAVMAVDLFAGLTASDPGEAQTLTSQVSAAREATLSNIAQAVDYLRAYALAPRVAVVGYGLGGGFALETAVTVPEKIDAVASYYGPLLTDADSLQRLRAPFLGLYAEHDASVPMRQIQEFRGLLRDAGNPGMVLIQSGTSHGFADPGRPAFDAANADIARRELTEFLAAAITPTTG